MLFKGQAIQVEIIEDNIARLCFDLQGEPVNKFNKLTLEEFREVVGKLQATANLVGVLVISAKNDFIVGADITEFGEMFAQPADQLIKQVAGINDVFNAFEDLQCPKVAAVNGAAMGGGLEMALTCEYRVAADSARLGVPEVKLGICPGFGGTVRLPRLIGSDNAVEWVCTGNHFGADKARKTGVVDAVVAGDKLEAAALDLLNRAIAGDFDWQARRAEKNAPLKLNDIERLMAFTTAKALVVAQAGPNYPAPRLALKCMEVGSTKDRAGALEAEHKHFAELAATDVSSALVTLFLNEQEVSRKAKRYAKEGRSIGRAGVLGAGTMGGGIAYQSASKGVPIAMKDINEAGIEGGLDEARRLLAKQVERGKLDAVGMGETLNRIRPTFHYDEFADVDIAVEAVVEKLEVKSKVLAEAEAAMAGGAVLASNTSTISITKLAESLKHPERFCGMHFFNPVHRMPLVEVIRGEKTGDETIATVVAFALKLGKTPIVVNDCPGFLVNRVLFPYFAGFNLLVRDGVDFHRIDRVMEKFGWPMGPAYLLDVVGIDIAAHAGKVMEEGFPGRLELGFTSAVEAMYAAGRYGQKNGEGFYAYDKDKRGRPKKTPDEAVDKILAPTIDGSVNADDDAIIARMMVPMCNEAVRCIDEQIVASAAEADMALIMGIGFPMFRGGALKYIDAIGAQAFCALADKYRELGGMYEVPERLRTMAKDGTRFF